MCGPALAVSASAARPAGARERLARSTTPDLSLPVGHDSGLEKDDPVVTCRFGVRRQDDDGSVSSFEVYDRATGAAVASEMTRADAEAEARRRNHDTSGPPAPSLQQPNLTRLQPPGVNDSLPRAEVQARAGWDCRVVVARTAQALDELREALTHVDRLIAEQQRRLEEFYEPFTARDP